MPVIVLAGEEEFELSRRLENLKKEVLEPAWMDLNLTVLRNPGIAQINDAAALLPLGPSNRMVLIEQCTLFTKKRGKAEESQNDSSTTQSDKATKILLDDFERSLAVVSPVTWIVFSCPHNFDSTLKVSKAVTKYADIEDFPRQRYWVGGNNPALENWCRKEAHKHGATIDDAAIDYLLESTEADLRLISSEIEKAAVYLLPDNKISLETISLLSSHQAHVFSLLDHWAAGNRKHALNDLDELLSRRSGIPVIALLNTSLSKWINIVALKMMPADELARRLNMKPFILKLELGRIKSLSLEYLVNKRIELARLESLVKTGQMSDQHALTLFVSS